jgi:hypothetical protein
VCVRGRPGCRTGRPPEPWRRRMRRTRGPASGQQIAAGEPLLAKAEGGWSKPRRRCFNLACRERARITGFFAPKEISFDPSSAP